MPRGFMNASSQDLYAGDCRCQSNINMPVRSTRFWRGIIARILTTHVSRMEWNEAVRRCVDDDDDDDGDNLNFDRLKP